MTSRNDEYESEEGRFPFGDNWARFLSVLDDRRIAEAENALKAMLGEESLSAMTFLDVGSGSGLSSLAARRLGAIVRSFDYDPQSVACTSELRRRFSDGENWIVGDGSALDVGYLAKLGQFDVVYSWGVLHHTGEMWKALENMVPLVRPGGLLHLAIYNTQEPWTRVWWRVKQVYNLLPGFARVPYVAAIMAPREVLSLAYCLLTAKPGRYIRRWSQYHSSRGMSRWHDAVDWVGGFPFETAKPEQIFDFYKKRGFSLEKLSTCGGNLGCNQFVFRRCDVA